MKLTLISAMIFLVVSCGVNVESERPSDAQLHAYKAVHHAEYLKVTPAAAGGSNKLIHTTTLPTEGTDPVVTPALDHLYTKAVIDLTSGPVVLEVADVPKDSACILQGRELRFTLPATPKRCTLDNNNFIRND